MSVYPGIFFLVFVTVLCLLLGYLYSNIETKHWRKKYQKLEEENVRLNDKIRSIEPDEVLRKERKKFAYEAYQWKGKFEDLEDRTSESVRKFERKVDALIQKNSNLVALLGKVVAQAKLERRILANEIENTMSISEENGVDKLLASVMKEAKKYEI